MKTKDNTLNSINQKISEIHYKVGRKLGEGMFSTVKLATHSLTGEKVAIKILEKTRISKAEDKERINREISILKKLSHFNISKLYQVVETKLNIYLIQEYIEGKDFMEYLKKKGKLKEIEACKFYHQLISGLQYIHQCGIAHRDFKPENILLTNNNTILKIIDFGLSNSYKKNQLLSTACGSPCYVPPEMVKEESYEGTLCDIWSSGIILYLMLCGKLPFYHEENDIMYEQILSGKFELPSYLSNNAKDILTKILEVEPRKRIKFEEIKSHPWFNLIDKNCLVHKGININEDIIPVDEEIIQKMEKIGFNKMEVRFNILKNFHNKVTTVYDLLLKQKIENGNKSIADLNSDLFDEYINNKKNKIAFYGSLENTLKNRICDENKKINILPNYYEDKYDDNNEDIIVGDNGSVIERLIKAGKFTYDEENMCLNRVTNTHKKSVKKEVKKENNNDGDSKFKTLSQMNNKPKKTQKKFENIEEKNSILNNKEKTARGSPKITLKKSPNKLKTSKKIDKNILLKSCNIENNKEEKEEKENKKDDDNDDWYKEIEAMIMGEKKNIRHKKSSSLHYRRKKDEDVKSSTLYDDNIRLNNLAFSNRDIKVQKTPKMTKLKVDKKKSKFTSINVEEQNVKPKSKFGNTSNLNRRVLSPKYTTKKNIGKNGKNGLKKTEKKIEALNEYFYEDTIPNNKHLIQSTKTIKCVKKVKKEGKPEKSEKSEKRKSNNNNKIKKFQVYEDDKEDSLENVKVTRRRGLSCIKRTNRIKI